MSIFFDPWKGGPPRVLFGAVMVWLKSCGVIRSSYQEGEEEKEEREEKEEEEEKEGEEEEEKEEDE